MALNLQTKAEVEASRPRAQPKTGLPRPLDKKARQKSKDEQAKAFRDEVWARDQGRCRATGKPLVRSGSTDWEQLGEVDHSILRSLAPERIYDTSNGLLLTKALNRLRKVACAKAPEFKRFDYEGPDNRALPQTFTWRDEDGTITRQTIDGVPVKRSERA